MPTIAELIVKFRDDPKFAADIHRTWDYMYTTRMIDKKLHDSFFKADGTLGKNANIISAISGTLKNSNKALLLMSDPEQKTSAVHIFLREHRIIRDVPESNAFVVNMGTDPKNDVVVNQDHIDELYEARERIRKLKTPTNDLKEGERDDPEDQLIAARELVGKVMNTPFDEETVKNLEPFEDGYVDKAEEAKKKKGKKDIRDATEKEVKARKVKVINPIDANKEIQQLSEPYARPQDIQAIEQLLKDMDAPRRTIKVELPIQKVDNNKALSKVKKALSENSNLYRQTSIKPIYIDPLIKLKAYNQERY